MNKGKIKKLTELSKIITQLQKTGKTVGLITGCFDIVHIGHLSLFKEAKKHVDVLVIGADNDKSIKLSKGVNRPVSSAKYRMYFLSAISDVDYCFLIRDVFSFKDRGANKILREITKKVNPNFLITNEKCDSYCQEKRNRARKLKIGYLNLIPNEIRSSSKIIERLLSEL